MEMNIYTKSVVNSSVFYEIFNYSSEMSFKSPKMMHSHNYMASQSSFGLQYDFIAKEGSVKDGLQDTRN